MKRILVICSSMALATAALAQQSTIGIASGPPTGTNYPMVQDIVRACSGPTLSIKNVQTAGGEENIYAVKSRPDVQFGVVPIDTAVFMSGQDKATMDKIKMVFPFFSTEIHVAVPEKSPAKSVADLAGKRVVEGPQGSATYVTTQVFKELTGAKWQELTASQVDGLNGLKTGKADAMFVVAGAPITMFKDPTLSAGIRLLPVQHSALDSVKYYVRTMIPGGTYPQIKQALPTYRVDNMLVTFDYRSSYHREIAALTSCITQRMDWLLQYAGKSAGEGGTHPKWKDVDPLNIDRLNWPAHPIAVATIKRELNRAKK